MFEHKKVLFCWESCTLELFVLVRLVFACPGARYCAVRRLRLVGITAQCISSDGDSSESDHGRTMREGGGRTVPLGRGDWFERS